MPDHVNNKLHEAVNANDADHRGNTLLKGAEYQQNAVAEKRHCILQPETGIMGWSGYCSSILRLIRLRTKAAVRLCSARFRASIMRRQNCCAAMESEDRGILLTFNYFA